MSDGTIFWGARAVSFLMGESVASALGRAGVRSFGPGPSGTERAVFCGIGQCQNCLVSIDGRSVEACLTICRDGLHVLPEAEGLPHV